MLQASEWLDLADVQPEDLIFQIVRQLVTDLRDAGFELGAKKFGEVFRRLREEFNREANLEMIEFGVDPLKFRRLMRKSPEKFSVLACRYS
jgi:carbamate kinase